MCPGTAGLRAGGSAVDVWNEMHRRRACLTRFYGRRGNYEVPEFSPSAKPLSQTCKGHEEPYKTAGCRPEQTLAKALTSGTNRLKLVAQKC